MHTNDGSIQHDIFKVGIDKDPPIPADLPRITLLAKAMGRDCLPLRVRQNQSIQTPM
jgi:hypothetical protein